MGLGRGVLQEQRVHGALEPDVQLVERAFRQGDDHPARAAQMLVEERHVGLVAAHPVERLGDDGPEHAPARVLQQRLDARTEDHAVAGDCRVAVGAGDLPALARGVLAADAELVLNGGRPLLIGRRAGIEPAAQGHGLRSPILRAPPCPARCRWRRRGENPPARRRRCLSPWPAALPHNRVPESRFAPAIRHCQPCEVEDSPCEILRLSPTGIPRARMRPLWHDRKKTRCGIVVIMFRHSRSAASRTRHARAGPGCSRIEGPPSA